MKLPVMKAVRNCPFFEYIFIMYILIATTSTNLAKPIISLSVIKTFDNLFWGDNF